MSARTTRKWLRYGAIAVVAGGIVAATVLYLRHTTVAVLAPRGVIAAREKHLMVITVLLAAIVVIPVFAMLFAFAWRYREGNSKKAKYSPELDGSRVAETIWWLIPSAIILILSVVTWNSSHALDPYKPIASSVKPLNVEVVALDWKWLFIYPQQNVASVNTLELPVNTPVNFEITADAPMNSFWIPQLGGQIYAMPGMSTQLHLMASQVGNYYGSSANISGSGFSGMNFMAHAVSSADFTRWVASAKKSPKNLTAASYTKLAAPSSNVLPTLYASADSSLYDTIVMKYMMPMPGGNSTMNMTAAQMQEMDMQ
ncbi:MAG TPA: ubiquinol oxidase subunit II [Candidatus Saccharimonadales bacterium]